MQRRTKRRTERERDTRGRRAHQTRGVGHYANNPRTRRQIRLNCANRHPYEIDTHTHIHTHAYTEKERKTERESEGEMDGEGEERERDTFDRQ